MKKSYVCDNNSYWKRYVWGFSDDSFNKEKFRDLDTALYVARRRAAKEKMGEHEHIYIGEVGKPWSPEIDGEGIIDMMRDMAEADVGDAAEGYLESVPDDAVKELTDALTKAFREWTIVNGYLPTFYTVENIKEYEVGRVVQA